MGPRTCCFHFELDDYCICIGRVGVPFDNESRCLCGCRGRLGKVHTRCCYYIKPCNERCYCERERERNPKIPLFGLQITPNFQNFQFARLSYGIGVLVSLEILGACRREERKRQTDTQRKKGEKEIVETEFSGVSRCMHLLGQLVWHGSIFNWRQGGFGCISSTIIGRFMEEIFLFILFYLRRAPCWVGSVNRGRSLSVHLAIYGIFYIYHRHTHALLYRSAGWIQIVSQLRQEKGASLTCTHSCRERERERENPTSSVSSIKPSSPGCSSDSSLVSSPP